MLRRGKSRTHREGTWSECRTFLLGRHRPWLDVYAPHVLAAAHRPEHLEQRRRVDQVQQAGVSIRLRGFAPEVCGRDVKPLPAEAGAAQVREPAVHVSNMDHSESRWGGIGVTILIIPLVELGLVRKRNPVQRLWQHSEHLGLLPLCPG